MHHYRENNIPDDEVMAELDISSNAFYVLKSRLFEKIQEHLLENQVGPRTDILRKLVTIPNLLFDTQRDIADAVLTKLEKDLLNNDMPYELTAVYSALKKLHLNSAKYYDYTQLYNKHVAYTLALDKSEDLLCNFVINLGQYYTSRDEKILEVIPLIKKEVANVSRLYDSHHLQVHKNILDASVAIFLPLPDEVIHDDPIEDLLEETEKIIAQYPKDNYYHHVLDMVNFLYFEFYHKLGLFKKADQYFALVNVRLPSFLYYNHSTFSSLFLISKLERSVKLGIEKDLDNENEQMFKSYQPDPQDIPNYLNYVKYMAASAYYAGNTNGATRILFNLLNDISLKGYAHTEIEIKLFLILTYSLCNKYDLAWNLLRNTLRKIRELNKDLRYENALLFGNMLKLQTSSKSNLEKKIISMGKRFELFNKGPSRMLQFIKLDEAFYTTLARPVKL